MPEAPARKSSLLQRGIRLLHPLREHSAFSATVLLMSTIMLSRVFGYVREAYIAYAFGAGRGTDAYNGAFMIPDWLNYIVAGGTTSITFISIITRYRAEGREDEADRAFSAVITIMSLVLIAAIVVVEIFTPQIVRGIFPEFAPDQSALCASMTRILLPAQLFFYVGGVVAAVLMSRRLFLFPALGPLFYNLFIILGGVLFSARMGISSLAYGALLGAFTGPLLANVLGAVRIGVRYRPSLDVHHPGFREWVRLSVPLMLGVSLVTADDWILKIIAQHGIGDISRLNYAKRLMAVPIAVLGQATGQASLPFFARIFGEKKYDEFARTVSDAVYRVAAAGLLIAAWMAAAALPIIDIVYRRGHFHFSDARETSVFFFWFALSLALWVAQGLYARGFYAAGDTFTPMVASTIITAISIPMYWWLFKAYGVVGLAIASDIGILANTAVTAALLDRRKLVPFGAMRWKELGKALLTATFAGVLAWGVSGVVALNGSHMADLESAGLVSLTWAAACALGLWATRSELPAQLRRRREPVPLPMKTDPPGVTHS